MAELGTVVLLLLEGPAPPGDDWLGGEERRQQARLRVPKRRDDWRLGRWVAKRAAVGVDLAARPEVVEVRPAPSGAPEIWLGGQRWSGTLSLSHAHGRAVAALRGDGGALGADLERVEERGPGFVGDYFTSVEQELWRASSEAQRGLLATLIWSAKESAFKALAEGLRLPTAAVEVRLDATAARDGAWRRLEAHLRVAPGGCWPGYWRQDGDDLLTVVGPGLESPPQELA